MRQGAGADGGRPLIGVSGNLFRGDDAALVPDRPLYPGRRLHYGEAGMVAAFSRAGATPLLVPSDVERASDVADHLDGLVLSGGVDVDPSVRGGDGARWPGQPERDRAEIALYDEMCVRGKPVLGICRGHQLLAVAEGASMWADLGTEAPGGPVHRDQAHYDRLVHPVDVVEGSLLASWLGRAGRFVANSVHHQAVRACPASLRVVARAADGTIEAVERRDGAPVVGVQWHPEWMPDDEAQQRLLACFVRRCAGAGTGSRGC